ncbi:MAG: type II toxin-antitoxin system HicB family antitoxin [Chlamydiia bacterium]|nr:type II toxin-antitoxin system HicB family antitoxin [Chlamydiia bacterium]
MDVNEDDIEYYMNVGWSYTIEQESSKGGKYYVISVNELPGVSTDAETIEEGMEEIKDAMVAAILLYLKNGEAVPVPVTKEEFRGNISYRTTPERHFKIARLAQRKHLSMSRLLDNLVDLGAESLQNMRRLNQ